jgi:hypothetical protein
MGFANQYLEKHKEIKFQIKAGPPEDLRYIVVIPCYYEKSLIDSLESLYNCIRPAGSVEILIVINSSAKDGNAVKEQNLKTYKEAGEWIKVHPDKKLNFHIIYLPDLSPNYAGAGYARKIGMDEAVRRFNIIRNPSGIIISFDADSICDNNYLVEIENYYNAYPYANGCSIYFEHPLSGDDFPYTVYNAITLYELHLRYYIQSLRYISFPYAYHTVGSCFTVKVLTYVKQGGMNKRKAGEDFYFLHKIIPLGNYTDLNSTRVIPSPRPSHRAPFGTGAAINKLLITGQQEFMTYNPGCFEDLKEFFNLIPSLFKKNPGYIKDKTSKLPHSIKEFLAKNNAVFKINEINNNCKSADTFTQRLFNWFNAFKVLKFLNFCTEYYYPQQSILSAVNILFRKLELSLAGNPDRLQMLKLLRDYEKNQKYFSQMLISGK